MSRISLKTTILYKGCQIPVLACLYLLAADYMLNLANRRTTKTLSFHECHAKIFHASLMENCLSKSMWVECRGLFNTDSEIPARKTKMEDLTVRFLPSGQS